MPKPPTCDTALLPTDPMNGEPRAAVAQPGYYPGYSTMAQRKHWDQATRDLLVARVLPPGPLRHFDAAQAAFWRTVFDHVLPQHDRTPEARIPIVEALDARLFANQTVGYRYEKMPHDQVAYKWGQQAINLEAEQRFGGDFEAVTARQRDLVLRALHDKRPQAAAEIWRRMPVARFWQLLMHDAVSGYYAHPWAWDEIGFGGPAYPRAYTRLERGEPEPWEVEETRYGWSAPDYTLSDVTESTGHLHLEADQNG